VFVVKIYFYAFILGKSRLERYLAGQMPGFRLYFRIRKRGTHYILPRYTEKIDAAA
jgi:hypothetical protein